MPNELVPVDQFNVAANFTIDKQDIVTVAIARGESKIRGTIKQLQVEAAELNAKIEINNELIQKLGEASVSSALAVALADGESAAGMLSDYGVKVEVSEKRVDVMGITNFWKDPSGLKANIGNVIMRSSGENGRISNIILKSVALPPTQAQIDLAKYNYDLAMQHQKIVTEAVNWKKKLYDMPAFERQMRAVVVQDQLNKTQNGKAVLDALDKNFEQAIQMIGM
jgi:hypothetical protein